jgi:hypothetical protein
MNVLIVDIKSFIINAIKTIVLRIHIMMKINKFISVIGFIIQIH